MKSTWRSSSGACTLLGHREALGTVMGLCLNHIVFVQMVQVPCTNELKLYFDITGTVTHFRIMIFTHLCCESLAQMRI